MQNTVADGDEVNQVSLIEKSQDMSYYQQQKGNYYCGRDVDVVVAVVEENYTFHNFYDSIVIYS